MLFYRISLLLSLLLVQNARLSRSVRCGRNLTATYQGQVITSPNYPRRHAHNLRCTWYISTNEPGRSIKFSITDLNTESCCDFLQVFDGNKYIGRYSGRRTRIIPIITVSQSLKLVFRSDGSVALTGFRAIFQTVNNCGSRLNATSTVGHFSTPFYPNPHPPLLDCYWVIVAPRRRKVQVTFLEGRTDNCCDFIEVISRSGSLGKLKGNISRQTFNNDRQISVYFHSDRTTNFDGFLASYREYECGGTYRVVDSKSVTVTSPNYPNATHHNLNCNYNISTLPGFRIELEISVDTERCCDFVKIYEGSKLLGSMRGKIPKSTVISTGRSLRIYFRTDGSVLSKGFTATFKQILPGCGESYHSRISYQYIQSPGYPILYPNNYRCDWQISAPSGANIVLDILKFTTETCCDYLEIFDGLISVGKVRGLVRMPFSIVTQTNSMRLHFYSDDSTRKQGFRVRFKQANNCGNTYTANRRLGTLSTPGYSRNVDYFDNMDCMWVLHTDDNSQVFLNITGGETEKYHDYIQILDNLNPVAKLSGVLKVTNFTSTGRTMRVYFHSDKSATRSGFRAQYNKTCNYYYNATTTVQFIKSPNYPDLSPHNYRCSFWLNAAPGQRIVLNILDFRTETCCDTATISQPGLGNLRVLRGRAQNGTIYSTTNRMRVFYRTDGSVKSRGFSMSFSLAPQ